MLSGIALFCFKGHPYGYIHARYLYRAFDHHGGVGHCVPRLYRVDGCHPVQDVQHSRPYPPSTATQRHSGTHSSD